MPTQPEQVLEDNLVKQLVGLGYGKVEIRDEIPNSPIALQYFGQFFDCLKPNKIKASQMTEFFFQH
ncbi:MAG: hypothetical protein M3525_14125 [Acidobacteriota bacterium]|nr:hypothetical protein [Acidobacteriota bacterium]